MSRCKWVAIVFAAAASWTVVDELKFENARPALFAAQFSLSHASWLVTYPLAGWLGVQIGLMGAFIVLGSVALLSVVTAVLL